MSKILFVNPPILKNELYGDLGIAGSSAYPLGLCSLAAVARENNFETQILDATALGIGLEETLNRILKVDPDYLGLTAVTITIDRVAVLAEEVERKNKNIVTILGGPHITAAPFETFRRYPCFDIGVIGEGEMTLIELLKRLGEKTDLSSILGLLLRKNGTPNYTGPRTFIDNLDTLPLPAWDLLPELPKYYHPTVYSFNRLPSTHLVTSRGCPGRCIFCDTAVFGKKYRFFSSSYVMKMIKYLYDVYGIRDILFDDDLFMGHRKRLFEICNMLIEEKLDLTWSCNARIDLVDRDILKLMKKAGCWQIAYGIESGSQKILDYIKKNTHLKQIEDVLKWTTEEKIRTKGFFMMAYPVETKDDIFKTIEFAKRTDLYDFQINFFTPLPGSEAYRIAKDSGIKLKGWGDLNLHTEPTFLPDGLSKEELIKLNKRAFREFYLRPKIIISYLRLMRNWENFLKLIRGVQALLRFWLSDNKQKTKNSTIRISTNYKKYESRNPFARFMIKIFLTKVSAFIKGSKTELMLDLGCGEGYVMNALRKHNKDFRFVGIDLDLESLRLAKQKNPSSLFVQTDILKLPFKTNAFGLVICLEVLEHIAGDPAPALEEIKRVSRNRVILSVPHEPLFSLANLVMGRGVRYLGNDPEHKHRWNKNTFLNLLRGYFDILKFKLSFPWIIVLLKK